MRELIEVYFRAISVQHCRFAVNEKLYKYKQNRLAFDTNISENINLQQKKSH